MIVKSFYVARVDPNEIFGMVGRCGGGKNTIWQDWSPAGRVARELIMNEFEEGINAINGHYEKLEKSMLEEGVRNPTIITCGMPLRRKLYHLPPELRVLDPKELLLCEGVTGGSRLYIAQKHNIPLPCIVNDHASRYWHDYKNATEIRNAAHALSFYTDKPKIQKNFREGVIEVADTAIASHLEEEFRDMPVDMLIQKRGSMWLDIMKRHGYEITLSQRILDKIYGR